MLKRVSIQNFKSLKDVTLDLQKVNLLIGPNNSGKSNFLKALEYMTKFNANTIDPNFQNIVFRKEDLYEIQIELFESSDHVKMDKIFQCKVSKNEGVRKCRGNYTGYTISYSNPDTYNVSHTIDFVGDMKIYRPDPNKFIKAGPVGLGEDFVIEDASNLVGYLDLMLSKYRKNIFPKIEEGVKLSIPEFDTIDLNDSPIPHDAPETHKNKSYKVLGLSNSRHKVTYWASELSEGTLYFLALLCIINQPNAPKVLLLEEPEKGIHPRRIWEVMRFIFQLAEERDIQVILTTHNEHVVNAFSSMPEAVFVFDKDEEGATHVRNLQRDIIEPSHRKSEEKGLDKINFTENLGESWLYGLIGGVPADEQ